MANNSSILKTLIYGDIFDYPLTKKEIRRFLIDASISNSLFERDLIELTPLRCERKNGYYFLSGQGEIVENRIKRKKESREKLEAAKKIIKTLSLIPTVLLIGISGGLALENSDEKDDIDLFVIASKNTLWITRLILVFLLIIMGQYRGRGKKESQKVCLNMLIDEEGLVLPKERQDLYTAHEIVQLRPVFERNNVYNKFMDANSWVLKFLPNTINRVKNYESRIVRKEKPLFIIHYSHYSLFILESIAKVFQLLYMKKHRTKETISDHMLAFHPFEYKNYVLEEYNKRLKRYEV